MFLTETDLQSIWLTLRLAGVVTLILFVVGTPMAWWLAAPARAGRDRSARWSPCPWSCRRRCWAFICW